MKTTKLLMIVILILTGTYAALALGDSESDEPVNITAEDFSTGNPNLSFPYRYLPPLDNDNQKTYPVVFYFHGISAMGSDNKNQINFAGIWADTFAQPSVREKYPAYLIAPQMQTGYDKTLISYDKATIDKKDADKSKTDKTTDDKTTRFYQIAERLGITTEKLKSLFSANLNKQMNTKREGCLF